MPIDPMLNPNRPPTKEDLEDFLGISRYRRFDAIYKELIGLNLDARCVWSELDKIWFIHFYSGKAPIFSIRWGVDYFYAHLSLEAKHYTKVAQQKNITPDALELLQKSPTNPTKKIKRIEANLEMMKDQEAFLQLLPALIRVLV
ncbi:MAG: DUF3788 family protein [Fidelibacterota bacterium]|nr:MAG: DUF3788 family protein [Candidatus Neomarinimicrobiota bacterium]